MRLKAITPKLPANLTTDYMSRAGIPAEHDFVHACQKRRLRNVRKALPPTRAGSLNRGMGAEAYLVVKGRTGVFPV